MGIEVLRSTKEVILNQRKYLLELILEADRTCAKPASTPLKSNAKLTSVDKAIGFTGDAMLKDVTYYQSLVGNSCMTK